jgi:thymidine phosphorylase
MEQIEQVLSNGKALEKFKQMIIAQGVSEQVATRLCSNSADAYEDFVKAKNRREFKASMSGKDFLCYNEKVFQC